MTLLRYLLLLLLLLTATAESGAQASGGVEGFPVAYGPTNVGRDYWFSFPANWDYAGAAEKYVRLYIASGVETRVDVYGGPTLIATRQTVPNNIITIDIPLNFAQPFSRIDISPIPNDQVYPNKALHVTAEDPIVVYGINRITQTTDGVLGIPVQGLGREYIIASAPDITDFNTQKLPSQYVVTAPHDNTILTIINTFDTHGHVADEVVTVTMMKGDVYSAMSRGQQGDLTGTIIHSTRPVAVLSGQNCTYLPTRQYAACDHIVEMMLPVSAWGKVYHLVPFQNRLYGDFIRVFSGAKNTSIAINGQPAATLPDKGGYEGRGWFTLLERERRLLEFVANKPMYVAQYNNSLQYDGVQTDPFYLVLTPVEQYQTALIFCTPSRDYPQNFINLVMDSSGWNDIEIAPGGTENWTKLSVETGVFPQNFPTLINGVRYSGVSFEIKPGTYRMRGKKPFAGYIYGWSNFDSYGYPLSVALGNLSVDDPDAPRIEAKQDCDGNVEITTTDLPADPSRRTNLSTIEFDPASFNYSFDPRPVFDPGESEVTTFKLKVDDPSSDAMAIIVISDGRGNTSLDTFYYTAFNMTLTEDPTDFGSMNINAAPARRQMILRNLASRPVSINQIILKSGATGFRVVDPAAAFTIGAANSGSDIKEITVEFTPTASGLFLDSIGLRDACGPHMMALLRAKVGTPRIQVTDADFDQWPVAATLPAERTVRIRNVSTDGGVLIVTGVASGPNNTAVFADPGTTPGNYPVFPLKIEAGDESKEIRVTFKPDAAIVYTDRILFTHNAGTDPANDSIADLTGEGILSTLAATPYFWDAERVGTGPYSGTVTLTNVGNQEIQIIDAVESGDVDDFTFDFDAVKNLTLAAGASKVIDVTFSPQAIGERELLITYNHSAGDAVVTSTLKGIGVEPTLATGDLDFGSHPVGPTEIALETKFYMTSNGNPSFIDQVTITDFVFTNDAELSFRYDATGLLPYTLHGTGDTLRIPSYFTARSSGEKRATLHAVTADINAAGVLVEATSNWIATATQGAPNIRLTTVPVDNVCDSAIIEVVVTNTGDENLDISSFSILPDANSASFRIIDPDPSIPQTLAPGESQRVRIMFTPGQSGPVAQAATLFFVSNDPNMGDNSIQIEGTRQPRLAVRTSTKLESATGGSGVFGTDIVATVSLDESVAARTVNGYTVTLRFDPEKLTPRATVADIKVLGANPAGTTLASADIDLAQAVNGILTINVRTNGLLVGTGELISVPFGITWDQALSRLVSAEVTTETSCVAIAASEATIGVDPICGFSVRLIEMTTDKYALGQNSPNPFNPTTKIGYSLGLDGPTRIELFDAAGTLVQVLMDEHQQPGQYEVTLDVNNLSSGMYYYRITSGDWSETKQMIVKK